MKISGFLNSLKKTAVRLLIFLLTGLIWEITRRASGAPEALFPSIPAILNRLAIAVFNEDLKEQILFSLILIGSGLAAGSVTAAFLVFLAELHPVMGKAVDTAAAVFHPLPGIALLPVVILWFGTGIPAVLIIIVHSVLWPLTVNLKSGYENLPATWRMVADIFGYSPAERFFRITLPGSFPFVLSGLKIAWARAWRALISAEMVFGAVAYAGGIGWFIFSRRIFMDTAGIFAGILVVVALGLIVEQGLFRPLEKAARKRWGTLP